MHFSIHNGDALEYVKSLPDNSVDCVLTDPPYFRKVKEEWDNKWATREDFLAWLGLHLDEWRRVLKPNGSLYVFASHNLAAYVEIEIRSRFNFLSSIVWNKPNAAIKRINKESLRAWAPVSERLMFAEHDRSDEWASGEKQWLSKQDELRGFVFEPLRSYLDGERRRAGIDKADINSSCGFKRIPGGMASRHYFSRSQWCIPTATHYASMKALLNENGRRPAPPFLDFHKPDALRFHKGNDEFLRADYEFLRADYEFLRAEYEKMRAEYESMRRPFNVTPDVQCGDVWSFNKQPPGLAEKRHPCEKPQPLIEHIINASTRPGAVILDPFSGSGAIGAAALRLGRSYIGAEIDSGWSQRAHLRLTEIESQMADAKAL